ncbi:MAG: oligopeptide/dipeptide ABC transporter ATP-binding protein [Acidimicrobiales bacterium]
MIPLLELQDVTMDFPVKSPVLRRTIGRVRAVDDVDMRLDRGETLGVVGESGSGKTTVGRIALGLLEPTQGRVLVEGKDVTNLGGSDRLAMRRRLQFVFQDPYSSLDPFSPIGDAIEEPLRTHRVGDRSSRRTRVGELLGLVGLHPDVTVRYPREFSGGQLQRIAIARALALDPQLIVLDEPVSSLDVSTQADVVNLLGQLQSDLGVAYLFIAHDLAVVDHISTRIAVMYLGQVVELGTGEAVVARPKHPYTLALLSAVPGREAASRAERPRILLRGDLPSPLSTVQGCRFHTRCPFVMDICREIDPQPFTAPDGSTATCHLHTEGPVLAGSSVTELPLPQLSASASTP